MRCTLLLLSTIIKLWKQADFSNFRVSSRQKDACREGTVWEIKNRIHAEIFFVFFFFLF